MIISIIGLGLIGGSLALALKKNYPEWIIQGFDCNAENLNYALIKQIIYRKVSVQQAVKSSEIIFLAIPVDEIESILLDILGKNPKQVIVDFGSTKKHIAISVNEHPYRKNYISAHPMAGTEFSGPQAADVSLFENKFCIICDAEQSSKQYLETIESIFRKLKLRIEYLSSADHDFAMAYLSHLSHVSSFALANSIFSENTNLDDFIKLSGGGLLSTIRLANSNAAMWIPILMQNSENVIQALDEYIENLSKIKAFIEHNETQKLSDFIHNANYAYRKYNVKNPKEVTNEN
jgi:prephenate dehydrogenase